MHIPSDVRTYQARQARYTGPRGPWLEHLVEDEGLTYEDAMRELTGWECVPYVDPVRGHMATLIKRNKEVHFAIYRKYRGRSHVTSKRIAEFLQPLLDDNIFLVTKVAKDESATFIEHLGFERLGSTIDGNVTTYILNTLRYPGVHHAKSENRRIRRIPCDVRPASTRRPSERPRLRHL